MVEHHPSKSMVAGSSPALRSTFMAANAQADARFRGKPLVLADAAARGKKRRSSAPAWGNLPGRAA